MPHSAVERATGRVVVIRAGQTRAGYEMPGFRVALLEGITGEEVFEHLVPKHEDYLPIVHLALDGEVVRLWWPSEDGYSPGSRTLSVEGNRLDRFEPPQPQITLSLAAVIMPQTVAGYELGRRGLATPAGTFDIGMPPTEVTAFALSEDGSTLVVLTMDLGECGEGERSRLAVVDIETQVVLWRRDRSGLTAMQFQGNTLFLQHGLVERFESAREESSTRLPPGFALPANTFDSWVEPC